MKRLASFLRNISKRQPPVLLALAFLPGILLGANCNVTSVGFTPLNDLGAGLYQGFQGGLYPGGANSPPAAHLAAGLSRARAIEPLDASGNPDPNGKYVLLSIGMSNAEQEFQNAFVPLANGDPDRDPNLVVVNGAQGGRTAGEIVDPNASYWSIIDDRLAANGVTPEQVVVAWVKQANRADNTPVSNYRVELQANLEAIARVLLNKYPNIQIAYYSSRIYAGYASTALNPEPYAYESGFVVKGTIETQLNGDPSLNFDPDRGAVTVPWLAWGPYLWANGLVPRSDGLTWDCNDFEGDGTHPATAGEQKVANLLLDFFKNDATAREWFLASPTPVDTVPPAAPTNLRVE